MTELERLLAERKELNKKILKVRNSIEKSGLVYIDKCTFPTGKIVWRLRVKSKTKTGNLLEQEEGYRNVSICLNEWAETPEPAIAYLKEIAKSINELIQKVDDGDYKIMEVRG